MKEISAQQLLQQIRAMGAELQSNTIANQRETGGVNFGELLESSIQTVSQSQMESSQMQKAFVNGTGEASLVEVMIAKNKADLSFQAMTEIRNKLVSAYQEIMNMPV